MIAVAELVHVEAEAGANVAELGELCGFGAGEVLVRGELHVGGFPLESDDLEPRPFGQCGIVGEVVPAGRCGAPVRIQYALESEGLRRLHEAQSGAVERAGDDACRHRPSSPCRPPGWPEWLRRSLPRRRSRAQSAPTRQTAGPRHAPAPRRARSRRQCLQPGPDRGLPRRAAVNRRQQVETRDRLPQTARRRPGGSPAGPATRLVPAECRKARHDHRPAVEAAVLLGDIATGAQSAAGCHHDGRDLTWHGSPA